MSQLPGLLGHLQTARHTPCLLLRPRRGRQSGTDSIVILEGSSFPSSQERGLAGRAQTLFKLLHGYFFAPDSFQVDLRSEQKHRHRHIGSCQAERGGEAPATLGRCSLSKAAPGGTYLVSGDRADLGCQGFREGG